MPFYIRTTIVQLLILFVSFFTCINCATYSAYATPVAKSTEQPRNPQSLQLNEQGVKALTTGDLAKAEDLFSKSLVADSGNLTAAFNLASVYLTRKKFNDAESLLASYIVKAPNDSGLHTRRGDLFFATKRIDEALKSYERAFSLNANDPELAAKLGTIYALSNKLADAERLFLKASELNPKSHEVLAGLGGVFLATGKSEKAIATLKRALQLKDSSKLYLTLGAAYELQRDPKSALIAYKRALDLGDKTAELPKKIEELEKVTGAE